MKYLSLLYLLCICFLQNVKGQSRKDNLIGGGFYFDRTKEYSVDNLIGEPYVRTKVILIVEYAKMFTDHWALGSGLKGEIKKYGDRYSVGQANNNYVSWYTAYTNKLFVRHYFLSSQRKIRPFIEAAYFTGMELNRSTYYGQSPAIQHGKRFKGERFVCFPGASIGIACRMSDRVQGVLASEYPVVYDYYRPQRRYRWLSATIGFVYAF